MCSNLSKNRLWRPLSEEERGRPVQSLEVFRKLEQQQTLHTLLQWAMVEMDRIASHLARALVDRLGRDHVADLVDWVEESDRQFLVK